MTGLPLAGLAEHVEHFRHRVLQDALAEATSAYWTRRAEAFEAAMPRLSDSYGEATNDEVTTRWRRLRAQAQACRNRARLSLGGDL